MRRQAAACGLVVAAAAALAARPAPRLLVTAEDFARIERLAQSAPWAAAVRTSIVQAAESWPAAHNQRYGLEHWELPPEGGQWTLWYICPRHGVYLQFKGPGENLCPVDGESYRGWPYDQVIYARRHSESAGAARDNGLAYRLTGKKQFAQAAAEILLAYADIYASYPIKDTNNRPNSTSGARVTAQTLDESGWLIPMAWAYDLIADSGVLNSAQRAHIEQDLLRAAAAIIGRYNAGKSNWQSWHNAAIGAVGFALEDQGLIARALDDPKGGFRFQMRESVWGDGVWYEGAWGYHFYALDPLCQLAEMAWRAGIDLYAERPLRRMFEAPLLLAMPDGGLPAFSDSGNVNLFSYDRLYEIAYGRYADPVFAWVLGRRARGREALLWGTETFPPGAPLPVGSALLEDSGNAVLRAAAGDHYLVMKFGPHGGGHGHYDKLNFVSYARGGVMAVDPGTQSYAAQTHNTWDKVTVAHNTVVVDERIQSEATGRVKAFVALGSVSAARAEAGPAYQQAALERTLILTPEYAVDVFDARSTDGAAHRFDWVYHNYGRLSSPLALAPYSAFPAANGYQHLSQTRAATTSKAWQAGFDMSDPENPSFGSTWANLSDIRSSFLYSREQVASGSFSGRMNYDFSAAQGYILFSAPVPAPPPAEVPARLALKIYGDGSGHKLALRLYDATDERFVFTVGPINWTGWRQLDARDPARWSHYLGNNDGVFDLPVKTAAVELTSVAGGPAQGALYADDIVLEYPAAGQVKVTDFDLPLRALRVWMLAAPETTVVAGEGLGPNLLRPVPFVMARRRGAETRFVTLLEPYGEAAGITSFRGSPDEWLEITGAQFDDRLSLDAAGVLRYVRRAEGALRRLALAGATQLEQGGQVLLELDRPVPVEADFSADGASVDVRTGEPLGGPLRLLAPAVQAVTLNGVRVEFRREGDYCVVTALGPQWPAHALTIFSLARSQRTYFCWRKLRTPISQATTP